MIDFHTHSLLSDGALLPSELARRAEDRGYKVIGITDHADLSNLEFVIEGLTRAAGSINKNSKIKVIPGVELTHLPLNEYKKVSKLARLKGAKIVLIHGETIVEPVIKGTNREAILSGIDILTHPGLISLEDARLANSKGVYLEITARKGHSLTNGHVVNISRLSGAKLVLNTDSHSPEDLITEEMAVSILSGAGLNEKEIKNVFNNSKELACKALNISKI